MIHFEGKWKDFFAAFPRYVIEGAIVGGSIWYGFLHFDIVGVLVVLCILAWWYG